MFSGARAKVTPPAPPPRPTPPMGTAVQVHDGHLIDSDIGLLEGFPSGRADRGDVRQVAAFGYEPLLVGVRAGVHGKPLVPLPHSPLLRGGGGAPDTAPAAQRFLSAFG